MADHTSTTPVTLDLAAPGTDDHALRSTPVPPQDRLFLLLKGAGPPVTGLWAFAIEGEWLDPDRLSAALRHTVSRHTRAVCRLRRKRGRFGDRLFWEPDPDSAATTCRVHLPEEFPGDPASIARTITQLQRVPVDLERGPLTELHWYPGPYAGGLLAFRFHHALGDGVGTLNFLADLFRFYGGRPTVGEEKSVRKPASGWSRSHLLWNLVRFLWWRNVWIRFAVPDHLHDFRKPREGEVGCVFRRVELTSMRPVHQVAGDRSVSFNDLLLAAWSIAIDRWKAQRGKRCGTLRFMVNQSLRKTRAERTSFDNQSSAFPIWARPADREDPEALLRTIGRQVDECREQRVAEGIALFAGLLCLPEALARRLVVPLVRRPRTADSLVISNLGRLPAARLSLPRGRIAAAYGFVRPPAGVGALHTAVSVGGAVFLCLSFFESALKVAEADRLLELVEAALREYAARNESRP